MHTTSFALGRSSRTRSLSSGAASGQSTNTSSSRTISSVTTIPNFSFDITQIPLDLRAPNARGIIRYFGILKRLRERELTEDIPKCVYPDSAAVVDIEELEHEEVTDVGVVRNVPHTYEGREHRGSIRYVKSTEQDPCLRGVHDQS